MKQEWRKHEKELYGVKKPTVLTVPRQQYVMLSGEGNPNDAAFSKQVAALYALAYGVKMHYKAAMAASAAAEAVHDFTVYPLEGVWRLKNAGEEAGALVKENLQYTIMIRQPDFITADMVEAALATVKRKKPNRLYQDIGFAAMEDGLCLACLHVGAYDDEPASFAQMEQYGLQQGFVRTGDWHREIYLSNAKRTAAGQLKTILRYPVRPL